MYSVFVSSLLMIFLSRIFHVNMYVFLFFIVTFFVFCLVFIANTNNAIVLFSRFVLTSIQSLTGPD